MHVPVLLKEVIEALDPKKGETMIDGTAGSGGHSSEILKLIGKTGKLLLVDYDEENVKNLKDEFKSDKNVICVNGNYSSLKNIMKENNFPKADGLLLDLGFSSEQLEKRGRGFSFQKDEPLLMTYNDNLESLRDFLKYATKEELTEIIRKYGEERYTRRIAEAIYKDRKNIETSKQLANIVSAAVPGKYEKGRIHPATRTFQAFRIFINKELENIEKIIDSIDKVLSPCGRVVIISFHSLEDRIVKLKFRELYKKGRLNLLTKKPIIATKEETINNPRSRSAKLRAAILK
ncbi:16S rRNA (cytosine(1402)-N(4))-methyltransferase RsmH [Candidatus Wolfebacteria bacterium]|nr:16S rRNA (cytosine(1402)-N(4))-methyltransferase RsmH [Candidatus Wolfebacteria bacterium]